MVEFYYFSTAWCGPCKVFKPVVQQVAGELGVPMQFIDAEHNRDLAQRFNITSVPAIIVVQGDRPLYRNTGVVSKTQLAAALVQFK